jgi:YbgC/YbaW family acyl-CoA thioester hydrolase
MIVHIFYIYLTSFLCERKEILAKTNFNMIKSFRIEFKVRSYECDSYGHVNNAAYLNYLEYARMSALAEIGFNLDNMKEKGYLAVIRRIEIDYKFPLFMNDLVEIRTFVNELKNSSGTFTQQILNKTKQQLAAEAKVTWVFINLKGKPIAIPEEIRAAFNFKKL